MGKFSQFKVRLAGLPQGAEKHHFRLQREFFDNMENPDIHGADLDVCLDILHHADDFDLTFSIKGSVTLLCDRCLDALDWPIDTVYSLKVRFGDGYNDEADDLLIIPQSDPFLNVAYLIHDTVALSIPMKHVHKPGLCNRAMTHHLSRHRVSDASATDADTELEERLIEEMDQQDDNPNNDSTDPRWDALKGLASAPDSEI